MKCKLILHRWLLFFICTIACSKGSDETTNKVVTSQGLAKYLSWHKSIKLSVPDTLGIIGIPQIRIDGIFLYIKLNPAWLIGAFDTTGKFIKTVGSNGFGPGELRRIEFFQVDAVRNIYVVDGVTDEMYEYNLDSGWISTSRPSKSSTMAFVKWDNRFIFFRRAYGGDKSYHIQVYEKSGSSLNLIKELLESSDESIRTRKLNSNAIAVNNSGHIVFTFFAPKVIYGVTPQLELFELEIEHSEFKVSETHTLLRKAEAQAGRGLIPEVFRNSRVLSLGFASEDIILLSFATGRYDETRFCAQFYSLSKRSSITKAIPIERPIVYIGNNTFSSWAFGNQDSTASKDVYSIDLFKFEVD